MNVGKRVNVTILYLNTSFWKIENFEYMLVVHRESKEIIDLVISLLCALASLLSS